MPITFADLYKPIVHAKVKFRGQIYWHHVTVTMNALSPLDHYHEDGSINAETVGFTEVSYALITNGEIWRFGEVIGSVSELEPVNE